MITGDLDVELRSAAQALLPGEPLPPVAATWRPAPDGDPASYATSSTVRAGPAHRPPAGRAGGGARGRAAAGRVDRDRRADGRRLPHRHCHRTRARVGRRPHRRGGPGVRPHDRAQRPRDRHPALARPARRADVGPGLAGPGRCDGWPARRSCGRVGHRTPRPGTGSLRTTAAGRRAVTGRSQRPPYLGADAVRYRLARTLPGRVGAARRRGAAPGRSTALSSSRTPRRRRSCGGRPSSAAAARSRRRRPSGCLTRRPSASCSACCPGSRSGWRPQPGVGRPAEVPHYLEQVAAAWTACRLACPALPFAGSAAPREAALTRARLLLADAVATVLAAGLRLAGVEPAARIGFAACPDDGYLWESPG